MKSRRPSHRRHRVALRRSHARYRWKSLGDALWTWGLRLALLALMGWTGAVGYYFWSHSDGLRVTNVEIRGEAPDGLRAKIGVGPGDHIFGFSPDAAEKKISREFPGLARVDVRRRLDRSVIVAVEKRIPAAKVFKDEAWWGLDKDGVLFPLASTEPEDKWVILADVPPGEDARDYLDFLGKIRGLNVPWVSRLYKMKRTPPREAVLFLKDGAAVDWGPISAEDDVIALKAARLEQVLENPAAAGTKNVRFVEDARIIVEPAPPEGDKEDNGKT